MKQTKYSPEQHFSQNSVERAKIIPQYYNTPARATLEREKETRWKQKSSIMENIQNNSNKNEDC